MHFFIHNSFQASDVLFTRPLIEAIQTSFPEISITLECTQDNSYLWQDLGLPIVIYEGAEYRSTVPTPNCPPESVFVNMCFYLFEDVFAENGTSFENQTDTFNTQMYEHNLQHQYLIEIPQQIPMIKFYYVEQVLGISKKGILLEGNQYLSQLTRDFPSFTFYCVEKPIIQLPNVIDCSVFNLVELSAISNKCLGFILKTPAVNAVTMTEINRFKPRCVLEEKLAVKFWDNTENPTYYAKDYTAIKAFFLHVIEPQKLVNNPYISDSTVVVSSSESKKPYGVFLNTAKANCSIYESGKMAYECLKLSDRYNLDYLEIDQNSHNIAKQYDFYVFNYHHQTMQWLDTKSIQRLPQFKATLVLEVAPNNPFVLCPSEDFDAYLALDPSMNVADKRIYAFPRPLETPHIITPYRENPIPVIGSFGFATLGKGFELVVDAVNKEFDEAIVRINIPKSTYGDDYYWQIHKRDYAEYLSDLCQKTAKKGVQVIVTHDFMNKAQLIEWCGQNTLNCFLYDRDMPGLSATTDQAISSGRPLAVSANETFRHIHQYIKPYPLWSLKESIALSQNQVRVMQQDWSPKNFATKFEKVLEDFGLIKNQANFKQKGICKFLKSMNEIDECTQYLKQNNYVSHRLVCKDWDLANILRDLSEGNLLDMGSSDSYMLKNAVIKDIKGEKYGIDLQEPDVLVEGVKYVKGDLMNTPFPNDFFQNITCLSVIEHEVDIKKFAKEVYRLLSNNGKLYLTFDYWNPKVISKLKIFDLEWNIFDQKEIMEIIEECKAEGLCLVDEVDWTLGVPVVRYWSPDPLVHYTFGMLVFRKWNAKNMGGGGGRIRV